MSKELYVRTKDNIYEVKHDEKSFIYKGSNMIAIYDPKIYQVRDISKDEIIKQANDIKDLCDEFILVQIDDSKDIFVNYNGWLEHRGDNYYSFSLEQQKEHIEEISGSLFGAIWIKGSKGEPILKTVAKIKGILPNGEIDWELL